MTIIKQVSFAEEIGESKVRRRTRLKFITIQKIKKNAIRAQPNFGLTRIALVIRSPIIATIKGIIV